MIWKRYGLCALGLSATIGILFAQGRTEGSIGEKAPAFNGGAAGGGKSVSLGSMLEKGPAFIYFIKKDCPINARAEKYYNEIYEASGGKANFVGIINADVEQYGRWQKRFQAPFPILLDHDQKIIEAYKAERSPWVIEVGTNGKITKVWPGYSEGALKELAAAIGKGSKVRGVDLEGAPANLTGG